MLYSLFMYVFIFFHNKTHYQVLLFWRWSQKILTIIKNFIEVLLWTVRTLMRSFYKSGMKMLNNFSSNSSLTMQVLIKTLLTRWTARLRTEGSPTWSCRRLSTKPKTFCSKSWQVSMSVEGGGSVLILFRWYPIPYFGLVPIEPWSS